jgi:YD repeat-containing protein
VPPAAGAGDGLADGGPPIQAFLGRANATKGVAVAPDGSIYIADREHNRLRRMIPAYPGFTDKSIAIASEDARQVYIFSEEGRHLSTVDALTKTALYTFAYDDAGRLTGVTDQYGSATLFSRDADGNLQAVTGPYEERTATSLDAQGYLASVTNANDEATRFSYSSLGLLLTLTGPRTATDVHRFSYDSVGRLTKDVAPSGSFKTLTRTDAADGSYSVALATRLGRTQIQRVSDPDAISMAREVTGSDGVLHSFKSGGGTITRTTPTTTTTTALAGDPRFSMQAPLKQSEVIQLKGGNNPTQTRSETRAVTLNDPADPFSVATLEETLTVNGLPFVSTWDAATSTRTSVSPEGRTTVETLDEKGALANLQLDGLAPISFTRDAQGKTTSVSFGNRTTRFDYDGAGHVSSLRDALAQSTTYERDAVGRPLTTTLPDGNAIATAFDADNNLVSVTPPGQPEHVLSHSSDNLLASYDPPAIDGVENSSSSYTYDEDNRLKTLTYPSGATLIPAYDAISGKLRSIKVGSEITISSYDAATGHLLTLTGDGQTLTFGYTGDTLTRTDWSGTVTSSVTQTLDSFFRPSTETVGTLPSTIPTIRTACSPASAPRPSLATLETARSRAPLWAPFPIPSGTTTTASPSPTVLRAARRLSTPWSSPATRSVASQPAKRPSAESPTATLTPTTRAVASPRSPAAPPLSAATPTTTTTTA